MSAEANEAGEKKRASLQKLNDLRARRVALVESDTNAAFSEAEAGAWFGLVRLLAKRWGTRRSAALVRDDAMSQASTAGSD